MAIRAPLEPGVVDGILARVTLTHRLRSVEAMTALAQMVEKEAKLNASNGEHRRGTPSPARPGSGPAVVSGDLRRSITHTKVTPTRMWSKVGPDEMPHRTYGRARRGLTNGRLGRILEVDGIRANGDRYPFLLPAFRKVFPLTARVFRERFSGWDGTT